MMVLLRHKRHGGNYCNFASKLRPRRHGRRTTPLCGVDCRNGFGTKQGNACTRAARSPQHNSLCPLFFGVFVLFKDVFFLVFCTITVSILYGEYIERFPFGWCFSTL